MTEHSVLNQISPFTGVDIYFDGWCNGKEGAITDIKGNGVYRFIEMTRNEHGSLVHIHENKEDNPVVIVGFVAYWMKHRNNTNQILKLFGKTNRTHKKIIEMFESYTAIRYSQFEQKHRDDPCTWKWDWDYEFYAKYIIPNEMEWNKQSEALFDYITDEDKRLVRAVMDNYIEYLKEIRSEKGYKFIAELQILRFIDKENTNILENLEVDEMVAIINDLSENGYIKVAWVEGHGVDDIKLLPKGRVYMKQLEEEERGITTKQNSINPPHHSAVATSNAGFIPGEDREPKILIGHLKSDAVVDAIRKLKSSKIRDTRFWYVIYRVLKHIGWLEVTTQTKFIDWVDYHFKWEWEKRNFKDVPSELKHIDPSEWKDVTIVSKNTKKENTELANDYYEFAITVRDTFVEIENGKIHDKDSFLVNPNIVPFHHHEWL